MIKPDNQGRKKLNTPQPKPDLFNFLANTTVKIIVEIDKITLTTIKYTGGFSRGKAKRPKKSSKEISDKQKQVILRFFILSTSLLRDYYNIK
jgi:hypothetical protein